MKSKVLMIVNPVSGKKKKGRYYRYIKNTLKEKNYEVDFKFTSKIHNARYIVKNYEDRFDFIIACGGDGTLNEVIQGIHDINKSVPIGYIPSGTTNDFAKSLNIPFNNKHLANNIENYKVISIDLGSFNGRVFNYAATFGLFAKTSYKVNRRIKYIFGRLAYVISGIGEVFNHKSFKMKIEYENNIIEDEFIYGSISNSHYVGGFHLFSEDEAKLNDGLFEVVLVKKPRNIFNLISILKNVTSRNFDERYVFFFRTNRLKITSYTDDCGWSVDGEYGGNSNEIVISNEKEWSKFLVP